MHPPSRRAGPNLAAPQPVVPDKARGAWACIDVNQTAAARLVYARLGEDLLPVAEFRSRSEAERRAAVCPACAAPVTIRLGRRRVWHVAHRPHTGSECRATTGESALHLNTKIALRDALIGFTRDPARRSNDDGAPLLEIALECAGATDCQVPAYREWPVEWDEVRVECRVGVHQPDLVLYRDGRPVGAVEVLVSHTVTPEKAAALRALEVPWLEVSAYALDTGGLAPWTPATPLPVHRASRDTARWRCPRHEAVAQLADARARYAAMKNTASPEATALVEYGRKLRETEAETQRLVAEAEEIRSKVLAYEADHRNRMEMLPAQIADARRRLATAKREFELAQRIARERQEPGAADSDERFMLENELRGLDAELANFESIRRALSGLRPIAVALGPQPHSRGRRTLFWCPVDIYRVKSHMGRPLSTRGVFRVERVAIDGKTPELWLVDDTNRCLQRVEASDEAAESLLLAALDRRLSDWRAQGRLNPVIVDRPSEWIPVALGENVPEEAWYMTNTPVPPSYQWDEAKQGWVLRASGPNGARH